MNKLYFLFPLILFSFSFAQSPVPEGARLELIANGFQFVEGPVWSDSSGLLFSDIPAGKIYRWTEEDSISVFLNPSNNSNGLTYDLQSQLILAQTGLRRVARMESNGFQISLADTFDGKKLNSPNDLAVKSDGSIFFTDPPFNIPPGQQQELSFSGIFRISPSGDLQLLDSSLALPNGICFSPDESKLYVNNSQARVIYVWEVVNDTAITNKQVFASITPTGYADGMKVDSSGNLYCTGPLGVWIFAPDGTVLDTILVPGSASNCNWGGEDGKTLYVTAGTSVYRINLAAVTGLDKSDILPGKNFKLYENYPNPFNPSTTITFDLKENQNIKLKILDILGKEVLTLINDYINAGNHKVNFYADGLSSGIYYYQLIAGNFIETKKLVLMK